MGYFVIQFIEKTKQACKNVLGVWHRIHGVVGYFVTLIKEQNEHALAYFKLIKDTSRFLHNFERVVGARKVHFSTIAHKLLVITKERQFAFEWNAI